MFTCPATIEQLTSSTMRALDEVLGWPHNIPGLIDVFGGPDRLSTGLDDAATGIDLVKSVLEQLQ